MAAGIPWSWESFGQYLDYLDGIPKGINYSVYVGHSALRTAVMGERAFSESANDDDLTKMREGLRQGLQAGAIGFSTSLSSHHFTSDDRPVASRCAAWSEVVQLVDVLSEIGSGVFEFALPDAARSSDQRERESFFARLRDLAITSGVPITHGVVPTLPEGVDAFDQLRWMDSAGSAGGHAFGQSHSRGTSLVLSFATQLPFDGLPVWKDVRSLPLDEQGALFRDPDLRARLVEIASHSSSGQTHGAGARPPDYETMEVLYSALPPNPVVSELAAKADANPVDVMIDLALSTEMKQLFAQPTTEQRPQDLLAIMRHPRSVMTFSDSGAHVYQIMDASIQTFLLAYWVRQHQEFTLEEAIRMITLVPALAWGLPERGLVRVGMVADLNVFDPHTVAPAMPQVVNDLPAGATRLLQKSEGFRATIINGRVVFADGKHTGSLPGQLIRGAATSTK
jgi:N-acyl-D-aspartate/D-glutamate deacylase